MLEVTIFTVLVADLENFVVANGKIFKSPIADCGVVTSSQ